MERPRQFDGPLVTLADGQQWRVPRARQLPHINGLNAAGQFERRCRREYRDYYDACELWLRKFVESWIELEFQRIEWKQEEVWPFSCQALALNYHLTPELIDLLELLQDDTHYEIVAAATHLEAAMAALAEKKTEDAPATPPG